MWCSFNKCFYIGVQILIRKTKLMTEQSLGLFCLRKEKKKVGGVCMWFSRSFYRPLLGTSPPMEYDCKRNIHSERLEWSIIFYRTKLCTNSVFCSVFHPLCSCIQRNPVNLTVQAVILQVWRHFHMLIWTAGKSKD